MGRCRCEQATGRGCWSELSDSTSTTAVARAGGIVRSLVRSGVGTAKWAACVRWQVLRLLGGGVPWDAFVALPSRARDAPGCRRAGANQVGVQGWRETWPRTRSDVHIDDWPGRLAREGRGRIRSDDVRLVADVAWEPARLG